MPRITISYRREDSGVITGRIFDRLVTQYGRDAIFRDIDDVPFGADFREHIGNVLDRSDIVLAIVGPRWLGPRGAQNRLGDEADPVRVEIETVLRKGIPLVPVLVLRASMLRASQLPETMTAFAYRNAIQVDAGQDFDVHMQRLIRAVDGILARGGADGGDEAAEALPPSHSGAGSLTGAETATSGAGQSEGAAVFEALPLAASAVRRRSRSGLLLPLAGIGLGAAAGFAGALWLKAPAGVAQQDNAAVRAAEHRSGDLAGKLAAARKQVAEQSAHVTDLQEQLDQAEQALGTERQSNAALRQQIATAQRPPQTALPGDAVPAKTAKEGNAGGTPEQRREVQLALRALGYFQGQPDGGFGAGTQAAVSQFQAFEGERETGALSEAQRQQLLAAAQRLDVLLDQPAMSPEKVAASSIPGGELRYARASAAESGKGAKLDTAEAAYWYALAGAEGDARALANLGTLLVRGQAGGKPDPQAAIVLWQAAAARGNAVAMFNLGALYEHGIGVPVDLRLARAWYERAAAHSHPEAAAALKRLGT